MLATQIRDTGQMHTCNEDLVYQLNLVDTVCITLQAAALGLIILYPFLYVIYINVFVHEGSKLTWQRLQFLRPRPLRRAPKPARSDMHRNRFD